MKRAETPNEQKPKPKSQGKSQKPSTQARSRSRTREAKSQKPSAQACRSSSSQAKPSQAKRAIKGAGAAGSPHRQYPLFGAYRVFQLFLPNASTDAPGCPPGGGAFSQKTIKNPSKIYEKFCAAAHSLCKSGLKTG